MFKDQAIIKELTRLISELQISETEIIFRKNKYNITPENLKNSLINLLYSECYATKESYQSGKFLKNNGDFMIQDADYINRLSKNNHTKDKVEQGWQIKNNYSNGFVEISRFGENRIVPVSSIKSTQNSTINSGGQSVSVYFAKEDKDRQPTFFYVFSDKNIDLTQKIIRVYWNITSEGAPKLIDLITKKLNYYNIPFLFKCLNHPNLYFRRDAAVLYIEDNLMPIISFIITEMHIEMKEYLENDVPLFCYQFRKGIGIAESPNSQESFGMNRIGIVVTALLKNISKKLSVENNIEEIAKVFLEKGIDPSKTFLNKGSRTLN